MDLIDLCHQGHERIIASWLVDGVIVDPGPASCLERLMAALGGQSPRAIALTHIHLDHAGGAGALAARFPEVEVWVHERGATHMVDPSRLVASATRLYGERMGELWGAVEPIASDRLRVLSGGERIGGFRVFHTPGHAPHHVCYLHEDSGQLFAGDVCGVRIYQDAPVLAPTPPPDIDLSAWRDSLRLIAGLRPSAIAPTHFGVYTDVQEHLDSLAESLERMEVWARGGDERLFVAALRQLLDANGKREVTRAYELAMQPAQSFAGLARHLRQSA